MNWKIGCTLYMQALKRLPLKFSLLALAFILILLITACQNKVSKYSALEDLINANLPVNNRVTEKEMVFVLADYDCEVCVNDLPTWIIKGNNYNTNLNMLGLYYQSGKKFTYADVLENTNKGIQWTRLNGYEILEEIAHLMPTEKGPFAITLHNKQIVDIYSINKSIYEELFKSSSLVVK